MLFEELKEELTKEEYSSRNDIRNIEDFYINYEKNNKVFGRKGDTEKIVCFFDKKLTSYCVKEIKNSLKGNKTTLMIAPTNSGKTYSMVNEVFKKNREELVYNILAVPARAQAQQVGEAYKIVDIVGGGEKIDKVISLDKVKEMVMVYDCLTEKSIEKIYNLLKSNLERKKNLFKNVGIDYCIKITFNLIIDEAHNITSSSDYRCKAIRNIERVSNYILENGGNVIYMTATPLNLTHKHFDRVIHFIREEDYKANTNKFNLFYNDTDKSFSSYMHRVLITEGKGIVRYNKIKATHSMKYYMEEYDKIKNVLYTNSDEKGYLVVDGKRVYNNDLTNYIINYEKLPNNDYCFITSMGDAGINITTIDGMKNKEDYKAYFIVDSPSNMDIMNVEQFFNRLRFRNNSYNLLMAKPKAEKTEEFTSKKEFYEIVNKKYDEIKKHIELFKDYISSYSKLLEHGINCEFYNKTLDEARAEILRQVNSLKLNGKKESAYLYLDEDFILQFDENLFMNKCWEEYNKQFFYNKNLLIDELKRIFNIDINVVFYDDVKEDINDSQLYEKMCAKKIFDNKEQLLDENFEKDDNSLYNIIKESTAYNDFKKLIEKGISLDEAVEYIYSQNKTKIKDKKRTASLELINELKDKDFEALYDLTHQVAIEYEYNKELLEKVLDDDTYKFFRQITKNEMQDAIKWYQNFGSNKDLNMFFVFKNSIITNKVYSNNAFSFKTKDLKQQKMIRDFFMRKNGIYYKTKGKYLTTDTIYELIIYLNKYGLSVIDYKLLLTTLCATFNLRDDLYIIGLNSKFNIEEAIQYYNKVKESSKYHRQLFRDRLEEEQKDIKIK